MASPDKLIRQRFSAKEIFGRKKRNIFVSAAMTFPLLLSACSSSPSDGAISSSSYVVNVLDGKNYVDQNVTVGPVTSDDLTPTTTVYTIRGQKFVANKFGEGNNPYIVALIPQPKQNEIFRRVSPKKTIFSPNKVYLQGEYENVSIGKEHLGYMFLTSGVIFSQ